MNVDKSSDYREPIAMSYRVLTFYYIVAQENRPRKVCFPEKNEKIPNIWSTSLEVSFLCFNFMIMIRLMTPAFEFHWCLFL